MKKLLKSVLPQSTRSNLRRMQYRLGTSATVSLVKLLGAFHPGYQAKAKEGFSVVGKLDYSKADIFLALDSEIEYTMRLRSCDKEPETVQWIEDFVKAGDVVYDIGANVGAYSLVASKHSGGKAKVFAFEPSFSTFSQLCKNIFLNRCSGQVIPLHIALSDNTGIATFHYSSIIPGVALHALHSAVDNKGKDFNAVFSQPVLSYDLDGFIRQFAIEPPTHVKLDVDGHELTILKGAERTLAAGTIKSIIVELEPALETSRLITELLTRHGFVVHSRFSHGQGKSDDTCNYIFVPKA
jgi:FkbM family methyltransferase